MLTVTYYTVVAREHSHIHRLQHKTPRYFNTLDRRRTVVASLTGKRTIGLSDLMIIIISAYQVAGLRSARRER